VDLKNSEQWGMTTYSPWQGESVFEGHDIDGKTWEAPLGEFRNMLGNPFGRRY